MFFFFSSRRRHTRSKRDWSSDVCSSDLERRPQRVHPRLLGQQVALPGVAARTRREHVVPPVRAAPRQGNQVVPGEALPVAQLLLAPPAELAAVVVTGEEEGVGHLAAEPAGHMDELDEPDDRRARDGQALALYDRPLGLDDLRLTVEIGRAS